MSKHKPFTSPYFTYERGVGVMSHLYILILADEPNYKSDPLWEGYSRIYDLFEACQARCIEGVYNGYSMSEDNFTRLKRHVNNGSIVDRIFGPKPQFGKAILTIRSADWKPSFKMEMEKAASMSPLWNCHAIQSVISTKDKDCVRVIIRPDCKIDGLYDLIKKIDHSDWDWHVIEYPDFNQLLRAKYLVQFEISVKRNWSGQVKQSFADYPKPDEN